MTRPAPTPRSRPTFEGFSDETLAFYAGLEADNSKAYWTDHKDVFERAVRAPLTALLAELEPQFGPAKLFRPHRDVRFSADKSPYKTHQGAVVAHPGGVGSWYVQVSAEGIMSGGGVLRFSKDQLARYRTAVDADRTGRSLATAVGRLTGQGWQTMGDTLVRVPRGHDPEHPRADLLRHKSFAIAIQHGDPDWFTSAACRDQVGQDWQAVAPVLAWIGRHVGADESPE